jgi:hypothetical protein
MSLEQYEYNTEEVSEKFIFGVSHKVNVESILNILAEYEPESGILNSGYSEIKFDCRGCAEDAINEYQALPEDGEDINQSQYYIGFEHGENTIFLNICQNLEATEVEYDKYVARAYFNDLEKVKVFIIMYNEILDELEELGEDQVEV